MRILVTNAQHANTQLLKQNLLAADVSGSTFAKLQRLNPQIDFDRIAPGTVLLLPDDPAVAADAGFAANADAFESLAADLTRALDVSSGQIKARLAQNSADQKALAAALKVRTVAAQIAADPDLSAQVKASADRSADVAKKGAADQKALSDAQRALAADLAALGRLLG
jgi:hypothetical protein